MATLIRNNFNLPKICVFYGFIIIFLATRIDKSQAQSNEPMFLSRSESFKIVEGDTVILPCEVKYTESYVVAWRKGIAILSAGKAKVSPDPRLRLLNLFNLQISNAQPDDAGEYICQIATLHPIEITHTIEVLVPPRIHHISSEGNMQVKKGSSIRLECTASGNPTPNVTWSRLNQPLPNGEFNSHSSVLHIDNADRHKGGVYICMANNGIGQPASAQVTLKVLYPPEIIVEQPVVFSGEGREATLVCIIHGATEPEVTWFKDSMQLDTTEQHTTEQRNSRYSLIIRKVHQQDFGDYSCVAENRLGKTRKTIQLSGRPNVATFTSHRISRYRDKYNISWSVESYVPIESYKLTYRMCPTGQSKSYPLANPGFNIHGDDAFNQYNIYNNDMDLNERYNDWREFIIAAKDYNHNLIQRAYHVIWNLLPDQYYEAKVMSKNRHGWSEWTPNFGFSTTGNEHIMRDSSLLSSYDSGSQKSYYTKFHFAFQLLILFISSTIQQLL